MTVARLHGVPLAGTVLEPPPPDGGVGAVLGVARPVLGLDEPKAALRGKAEAFGVVVLGPR